MDKKLLSIGEAAKKIGVSIDTLRRWDKKGILTAIRPTPKGHRYYNSDDIELYLQNIFAISKKWVLETTAAELDPRFYCPNSAVFQTRLKELECQLLKLPALESEFSLITSIVGEIGNNSFDHNLGSWADVAGILFAFDINKRQIALADRGQGILKTLKRVRPELADDEEALLVAFTEKVTGRAPENRGNGLKFVRKVITECIKSTTVKLYFQSGKAALHLKNGDSSLNIITSDRPFRGCLALITF